MKRHLRRFIASILFLMTFTQCQKDDYSAVKSSEQNSSISTNRVDAEDIPQIITYLEDVTEPGFNSRLRRQSHSTPKSNGTETNDDLGAIHIQINDVLQLTNEHGLSNYSFKVFREVENGALYFINKVVKETSWGTYSYYMELLPSTTWMNTLDGDEDISNFKGTINYYDNEGRFVSTSNLDNGQATTATEFENPCPDDGTGTSTGGGTGNGDSTSTGTGSGNGDAGNLDTLVAVVGHKAVRPFMIV